MDNKTFIRTLKMQRGRYASKPNAESEAKVINGLVEKVGGKLNAIAMLNESNEHELKDYLKSVMGISSVKSVEKTDKVSNTDDTEGKKVGMPKKEEQEYGYSKDGKVYVIDSIHKTCKRVYKDLKDINFEDLDIPEIGLQTYQRYLKDKFEGETCTLKKGKLIFRDYRISLTKEDGFMVEDIRNKYEVVATPWEGIPTPAELGEWFKKPVIVHTPEEIAEAIERGKEIERKRAEEAEAKRAEYEKQVEEFDFEKGRRKVLRTIQSIRDGKSQFDPLEFPTMIPFKRWKRKVNSLISQWKKKEIRYAKLINGIEEVTENETFVIEEKRHRSSFKGTCLPDHEYVGYLRGDKLEVDGKLVPAVPFLLEYLLFHEPKAMSQIMHWAYGDITDMELLNNPIDVDWKMEYDPKAVENTAHNARVLTCIYEVVGIVAPQDLLYETDLNVGDVILLLCEDGKFRRKKVASIDKGVVLGKEVGLLKTDKWILAPEKKTK